MTYTTIKRSVSITAIKNLKEAVKDWREWKNTQTKSYKGVNEIIADCETVIAALEGDTITIEN